ncbi:MAG: G8 domain-containing protein [Sutterellaceae bacterium]|nr:G8 domain-containing protein [Burkholderiaceae bacterium]MDW8429016.1 G8 domain-containing protein [Sutterellaceae bacterium]
MGFLGFQSLGGAVLPRADSGVEPLRWSDPRTWQGRLPGPDDIVHVPAGHMLLVDIDLDVAAIEVHGALHFDARDLRIRTGWMLAAAGGVIRAGDPDRPHTHRLTITLRDSIANSRYSDLGAKFLAAVDGGTIDLCGQRRIGWSVLADSVFPGGVVLKLAAAVDWRVGERIVIASGGAELPLAEERTVAALSSDRQRVTLDRPLAHRHLGRNAPVQGALPGTIGKAALLSRDLIVEGDERSEVSSIGAHCLIAPAISASCTGRASQGRFIGVEFRRVGQFNQPGRYPLHWRNNAGGAPSVAIDCVVHRSFQRGVVVLGSDPVRLQGNVVYRPLGHGFIVDRADDSRMLLTSNLAIRPRTVRFADPGMRMLCEHRPRAIWFAQATGPRTLGQPLR